MLSVDPRMRGNYSDRVDRRYNSGRRQPRPKTGLRWPQLIFLLLLLAVVVTAGLFVWDHWFRYDDAKDFQNDWALSGTASTVTINADYIVVTTDVHYSYKLDTWAKTITYSFGDLQGAGVYRFSADRTKLVIIEGGFNNVVLDAKIALNLVQPEDGTNPDKTTVLIKPSGAAPPDNASGSTAGDNNATGDASGDASTPAAPDNATSGQATGGITQFLGLDTTPPASATAENGETAQPQG